MGSDAAQTSCPAPPEEISQMSTLLASLLSFGPWSVLILTPVVTDLCSWLVVCLRKLLLIAGTQTSTWDQTLGIAYSALSLISFKF